MAVFVIVPRKDTAPDFLVVIPQPERNRYRISMLAPQALSEAEGNEQHGIVSERPGPALEELQVVADRLLPGAHLSEPR
jgi:hypothetical protein